jgi:amino acid transporter
MTVPINKAGSHRERGKVLGVPELIAIALGGMVGGGIFTILGISVAMVGVYTPLAIALGGLLAALAAYSYIKLGVYYRDEGATYSFFKRTFPRSSFAASLIGWWIIFGYISTLALYAYTFASYALSGFAVADNEVVRKLVAGAVILVFTMINIWSVRGMGKLEDLMVYTKLIILAIISFVLINNSTAALPTLVSGRENVSVIALLMVSSVTFVAYEGFQLVINAVEEMDAPERNIPLSVYSAIAIAVFIYVVVSYGAIVSIPLDDIVEKKEYALASGASEVLGHWGRELVIVGALLATSSAISGTVFGASRQMAVIASDGFFPAVLARRVNQIPVFAIACMSGFAFLLILAGSLEVILEFGSVTFLLVSLLMAFANFKIRGRTGSSLLITSVALCGLLFGTTLIFYFEFSNQPKQLLFILVIYAVLTIGSLLFSKFRRAEGCSPSGR